MMSDGSLIGDPTKVKLGPKQIHWVIDIIIITAYNIGTPVSLNINFGKFGFFFPLCFEVIKGNKTFIFIVIISSAYTTR